jgi:hypothetical protein
MSKEDIKKYVDEIVNPYVDKIWTAKLEEYITKKLQEFVFVKIKISSPLNVKVELVKDGAEPEYKITITGVYR